MKKGIMTLVILGCLVLGGIFLYLKIDADTTPPEIHVDNENLRAAAKANPLGRVRRKQRQREPEEG